MPEKSYWSYWVHKVDQLWKEVEDLKKRVDELERKIQASSVPRSVPSPASQVQPEAVPEAVPEIKVPKKEVRAGPVKDPVIQVLRQRGPLNIIDLNSALKDFGINESVRETLFNRVKKLMQDGLVGFDEQSQTFYAR